MKSQTIQTTQLKENNPSRFIFIKIMFITGDGKYREYNEFNQLTRIRNGTSINGTLLEEYVYHPTEDRVLAKRVYNTSYSTSDHLVETVIYVNDNLVRTVSYPAANRVNTSDKIYVKDGSGIVAEMSSNQSKLYYLNDHLGSTGVITNETGGIVEQTFYEPFGGIISGGNKSRFYYEGKDFSSAIGEYDFNFRKYNPDLKIFVKPDSGINNVYDPQELNRYTFEKNNPYKYVDPDGKIAFLALAAPALIGGGIAAGVSSAVYFYQVYNGERVFNSGEYATIAGTSFVSGALVTAVAEYTAGMGLLGIGATGTAGFVTSFISQAAINKAEGNPLEENLVSQGIIGGLTAGMFYKTLDAGNYRIKNPLSYFTTKTGGKFARFTFTSELLTQSLGYSIDQTSGSYGSRNQESSKNNLDVSGSYYCDSSGCYCGIDPSSDQNEKPSEDYCNSHSDWRC